MARITLMISAMILFLTAGCAVQEQQKLATGLEQGDIQTEMISFKTIKDVTDTVIGYIEEVRWRETQRSGWQPGAELFYVQYIYDSSFRQKGFVSAQGEARSYRQDVKGEVNYHGIMPLSDAVKRILEIDPKDRIYIDDIQPMYRWEADLKK
ncbi:MAG: hypothetical protein WC980_08780 [Candidatus Brocadiia bacterium]